MYEDVAPAGIVAGAVATLPATGLSFDVVLFALVGFALMVVGLRAVHIAKK
jgi:LPXTG-motif cell wall-anchored protein